MQGSRPTLAEDLFLVALASESIPMAKVMPEAQVLLLGWNMYIFKIYYCLSLSCLVGHQTTQQPTPQGPLPWREQTLLWHLLLFSREAASGQETMVLREGRGGWSRIVHTLTVKYFKALLEMHTHMFCSSLKLMKGLDLNPCASSETSVIMVQKLSLLYKTSKDDLQSYTWVIYLFLNSQ